MCAGVGLWMSALALSHQSLCRRGRWIECAGTWFFRVNRQMTKSIEEKGKSHVFRRECRFVLLGYADSASFYSLSQVSKGGVREARRGWRGLVDCWATSWWWRPSNWIEKATLRDDAYEIFFVLFCFKGKRRKNQKSISLCGKGNWSIEQTEKVCITERMSDLGPHDGCLRVYYKPFGRGYNLRRANRVDGAKKKGNKKKIKWNSGQQNDRTNGCVHPFHQVPPPIS